MATVHVVQLDQFSQYSN